MDRTSKSSRGSASVSWAHSSPEALREHHWRDAIELAGELPDDVVETELFAEGNFRGGLLFTPHNALDRALIVYFHGGGFVAGSPETHRCVTAWLARLSGMRVLSARYRLAPEHPFPAQREDASAACAFGKRLASAGSDRHDQFIAGDSAGACVSLWALDTLEPGLRSTVRGVVLFYGAYGLTDSKSIRGYGTPENGLDAATLEAMYRRLGDPGTLAAERFSPIEFAADIAEPCYVLGAEFDAVLDDSRELWLRLGKRDTGTRFVLAKGEEHGFLKRTGRDGKGIAELKEAAAWISAHSTE